MPKGDPIRQIAASLSKVPAESVDQIITEFKPIAERHGGRFMNGRYQLSADVGAVYNHGKTSTVIVKGTPAGFWSIKSYGRGAVRPTKKRALSTGSGDPFASAGPARGNRAWDNAVADLAEVLPDVVVKVLGQVE